MREQRSREDYDPRAEIKELKREVRDWRKWDKARRQRNQKILVGGAIAIAVTAWGLNTYGVPSFVPAKATASPTATVAPAPVTTTTPPTTAALTLTAIAPMTIPPLAPVAQSPTTAQAPIQAIQVVKVWGFDTCANPNPDKVKQIQAMAGPFLPAQVKAFVCS